MYQEMEEILQFNERIQPVYIPSFQIKSRYWCPGTILIMTGKINE